MNIISQLKTLSFISAVAFGLILSPTLSMADDGNRGHKKDQYSHDRGQMKNKAKNKAVHHGESHKQRGNSHVANAMGYRGHVKQSNKHRSDHHYDRARKNHNYHKHGGHGHNHNYVYSSHSHSRHVNHDHAHRGQYVDFDNLRFMFGLHTGNFDIIFRD